MNRQEAEALLPWHVAGSLSADEAQAVQAFIDSGQLDPGDIAELQTFAQEVRSVHVDEPAYNPALLDSVLARLDEVPQESILLTSQNDAQPGFFARLREQLQWSLTPAPARWAMGAQFAIVAGLVGLLTVGAGESTTEVISETVAGPQMTREAVFQVGFESTVTAARLSDSLNAVGLEIVGGPSAMGFYLLAPVDETAALAELEAALDATGITVLLQPAPK